MFNPTFTDPNNALLRDRLARAINYLRDLSFSTREEYQAEVYNKINRIINRAYAMSKLTLVNAFTPAKISDFEDPITTLNDDAVDIISELQRIEDTVSQFYNLSAAAENELRQRIRTTINSSTQVKFFESFIDSSQISSNTGQIDANAGHCTTSVISEVVLKPTVSIGSASVGTLISGNLTKISDTSPQTYTQWVGNTLQLIFTFDTPTPINRIYIKQYDYKDLGLTDITSTPDGTYSQSILKELGIDVLLCGITANKSSGETTIDFSPKSCKTLSITIEDKTGTGSINLDWIQIIQRKYQASSLVISQPIIAPIGRVLFKAETISQEPYSIISHQISFDGTNYQGILPGQGISIQGTQYWYRSILSRNESLISASGQPLNSGLDPASSTYYSISSISSVPIGNNLLEKTLVFNSISGPITIQDPILLNTLTVQQGASVLPKTAYTFVNGILNLNSSASNVTVVYQTNKDASSIASLLNYFSPILVSYSFERI